MLPGAGRAVVLFQDQFCISQEGDEICLISKKRLKIGELEFVVMDEPLRLRCNTFVEIVGIQKFTIHFGSSGDRRMRCFINSASRECCVFTRNNRVG
jgi:hypothetical protein